ncbi:MAG: nucleotide exchange factor GrpE, partial [Solirubrobacterales bacterium]
DAPEDPLAELTRERDEYLDLAQRTRAAFDNYRKRVATESEQAVVRVLTEVSNGVIGALDNLERAMETEGVSPEEALAGGLPEGSPVTLQGLVVAYRDLVGALASAGIEQFDPAGEEFDPNLHEALQALEADGTASGTVLEVMQRGYRAGDQVIRAARVVVSK